MRMKRKWKQFLNSNKKTKKQMEMVANQNDTLTIKKLRNHLILTLLVSLILSGVTAVFTSYRFYLNTNNNLDELNENKIEVKQEMKELKNNMDLIKSDIAEIKTSVSNSGIYTDTHKERIVNLENDVKEIRKSQEEMLKVLYQIKGKK